MEVFVSPLGSASPLTPLLWRGEAYWDGTFHQQACPEGLYIYTLLVIDQNGERNDYRGKVMLVR